jgi:predicted site-specific integrase-resolvase
MELLKKIPKGKAMVTTEDEIGAKGGTVRSLVARYIKAGKIPPTFTVVKRSEDQDETIYIINRRTTEK